MPKLVQIDDDLYARVASAASREGKHVGTYMDELIRLQIREVERMHQVIKAFEEIAIQDDAEGT
ncbi:hypothetical protein [Bradyrhizobium liaoningense]|uniref:hypothetical protein n=1 Tax=Bradyrhizobium liaoningense TaxID=43992 RepID=UPI001BAB5385|nr:hypothetical protein [Bradyrhizobium liaoningense]MBR1170193.1 hypothetical protein [Bradyrhizobium liaoningense]